MAYTSRASVQRGDMELEKFMGDANDSVALRVHVTDSVYLAGTISVDSVTVSDPPPENVYSSTIQLTATDSARALAASTEIVAATIKAHDSNVGPAYIGDSGVDSTSFTLSKGESVPVYVSNLSKIFFKSDTTGDKVSYLATGKW